MSAPTSVLASALASAGPAVAAAPPAAAGGDRPYVSPAEVVRLVEQFEAATLSHAEWTHRAHLTVALWYATHHPPREALDRMRVGLVRLNAAHGIPITPTRGYHETITRFYMHVVGRFVALETSAAEPWDERANRLFERLGARDLTRRYYSESRLMSGEARAAWVEPDLQPLP